MSNATGIGFGLEIAIRRDEEAKVVVYEPVAQPRPWQIGDVVTIGNRPERRILLSLSNQHIIVIADSGWWNIYEKVSSIPIHFHGHSGLVYTYTGREQTYRDHLASVFAPYFNTINA